MKRIMIIILVGLSIAAYAWSQATQPVNVQTQSVGRVVQIAQQPQIIVVQQPSSIKTIDIALWLGYHDGSKVRIAIDKIHAVRPHSAGTGTAQVNGTAIDCAFGVWYTTETSASVTQRLSALNWGEGSSTLMNP